MFFAFIDFDAASDAAEEIKNPRRYILLGIGEFLKIFDVLNIGIPGIATGIVPYINFAKDFSYCIYALYLANYNSAILDLLILEGNTRYVNGVLVMSYEQTRILRHVKRWLITTQYDFLNYTAFFSAFFATCLVSLVSENRSVSPQLKYWQS